MKKSILLSMLAIGLSASVPQAATYQLRQASVGVRGGCTLPNGSTLLEGTSVAAYSSAVASEPQQCSDLAITVTCSQGQLSGPSPAMACIEKDPYYANVSLLAHFNTNSTDVKGKTATNSGTSLSTTTKKFGNGAWYFPGTTANNLLYGASSDFNFGTGDFTLEGWFYKLDAPTVTNNDRAMISGVWGSWTTGSYWVGGFANNGTLRGGVMGGFVGAGGMTETSLLLNQWVHYAWVREGTQMRMYRNGTLVASAAIPVAQPLGSNSGLYLGRVADNGTYPGFYGYMDEVRITKGVARYSANFTPINREFPNQ